MKSFVPDYTNITQAACNIKPKRMPLYEHIISEKIMEQILGRKFAILKNGDLKDKKEYLKNYVYFFKTMGYDSVSFERLITAIMPGNGALYGHKLGIIKNLEDFRKYPWESIPDKFFETYGDDFRLLGEVMPVGMKAVGGPGNGVFECLQDIIGYTDLCYIAVDDPELYDALFKKMGEVMLAIWRTFLLKYGDVFAICRFGDDLGFRSSTLISPLDIHNKIIPQYQRIIQLVHSYHKPFLLHSCGHIFEVMEDLVKIAKIDAKHSNEDEIAIFKVWVEKYGDSIGNFGGVDMNVLCLSNEQEIKEYVREVIDYSIDSKGFALGSGNSIPEYVPVEGYLAMIEAGREARGE
jgi:uroporphyrinogen decarboxylase